VGASIMLSEKFASVILALFAASEIVRIPSFTRSIKKIT
jgi:hypothetical protein